MLDNPLRLDNLGLPRCNNSSFQQQDARFFGMSGYMCRGEYATLG